MRIEAWIANFLEFRTVTQDQWFIWTAFCALQVRKAKKLSREGRQGLTILQTKLSDKFDRFFKAPFSKVQQKAQQWSVLTSTPKMAIFVDLNFYEN